MNKWIGLALVAVAGSVVIGCAPQEAAPADTSSTLKQPDASGSATTEVAKKSESAKFPTAEEQAAAMQRQVADTEVGKTEGTKPAEKKVENTRESEKARDAEPTKKPDEKVAESKPVEVKASPDAKSKMTPEQRMAEGANTSATAREYVGRWVYDIPARQREAEEKLVADMKKEGKDWKTTSITVEFKGDGTFSMREVFAAFDRRVEGTYKVVGGIATLTFKEVNGEAPKREADKNGSKMALLSAGNRARRLDGMEFVKR